WHLHVLDLEPRCRPLPFLVRPMRVMAPIPEAEGLAGRHGFEKCLKRFEHIASRVAGAITEMARAPSLAHKADDIAGFFQDVGIDRELGRQDAPQVTAVFEAMRGLAGEDR